MKYGTIAPIDKPVSRIVAGSDYLMGQTPEVSFKAYDAFWEGGGRAFDSAFGYGDNTTILGAWVRSRGVAKEAIFLDKVGHPNREGSTIRRDKVRAELARNHVRLGVEKTDLCVFHRDDPEVPVGEIVDWMNELIAEGRIVGYGGSNWTLDRIREGNAYAEAHGKQGFSVNNPTFSLAIAKEPLWHGCVTLDDEGRRWHEETGFPLCLWSSTARGWFAGTQEGDVLRSYDTELNRARRERARDLAETKGVDPVGIALSYVLSQPMNVFALCGLRTAEQATANCAAADLVLTPEEIAFLETGHAHS